jgi:hypothetical protein
MTGTKRIAQINPICNPHYPSRLNKHFTGLVFVHAVVGSRASVSINGGMIFSLPISGDEVRWQAKPIVGSYTRVQLFRLIGTLHQSVTGKPLFARGSHA